MSTVYMQIAIQRAQSLSSLLILRPSIINLPSLYMSIDRINGSCNMLMSLATTAKGIALIGSVIYDFAGIFSTCPHCLFTDKQGTVSYIAGCIYFEACIVNNFDAYVVITVSICNNSHVACVGKCNGIIIYFCCCAR